MLVARTKFGACAVGDPGAIMKSGGGSGVAGLPGEEEPNRIFVCGGYNNKLLGGTTARGVLDTVEMFEPRSLNPSGPNLVGL